MNTGHPRRTVGILLPSEESPFTTEIMQGLRRGAEERDLRLLIFRSPSYRSFDFIGTTGAHPLNRLGYEPSTLAGTLLFFGNRSVVDHVSALNDGGHPCLLALRPHKTVPHIVSDDAPAVAAIVRRLHRHGHRRIAHLRGLLGNPNAEARLAGYRAGLADVGLPFDPDLILPSDFAENRAFTAVDSALSQGLRFTAVVACNDLAALGALAALSARGLSSPGDVEIVGFDNRFLAPLADPPLSTFEIPLRQIARTAVDLIARRIEGNAIPLATLVRPAFVNRASTRFTDSDPACDAAGGEGDPSVLPPEADSLLERIPVGGTFADTLAAAEGALASALRLNLDLDAFTAAVIRRTGDVPSRDDDAFRLSLSLARSTARMTHVLALERAQSFRTVTIKLRQLTLGSRDGQDPVHILRHALTRLGFAHARLHLAPSADDTAAAGVLYSWDLRAGTTATAPASLADLQPAALSLLDASPVALVFPLIANDVLVGTLVTDDASRFVEELAEFSLQFPSALHGARLYRDLSLALQNLRSTQQELVEASRHAGIAEVATGVLHNIGNALNGVNTSTGIIADSIHTLRPESVGRLLTLLTREGEPWTRALADDERGRKILDFLRSLESHLATTRGELLHEVQSLREAIDHVNQIVAAQQQLARTSDFVEEMAPSEPIEYALRICESQLLRHDIAVIRDYQPAPRLRLERHKAVQILVNLLRNAKDALLESAPARMQIRVGVFTTPDGHTRCFVADNGAGIAPEILPRLFTMGFTTKQAGHGFGLHNSALLAASLGGSLSVESPGSGQGATFYFDLPPP